MSAAAAAELRCGRTNTVVDRVCAAARAGARWNHAIDNRVTIVILVFVVGVAHRERLTRLQTIAVATTSVTIAVAGAVAASLWIWQILAVLCSVASDSTTGGAFELVLVEWAIDRIVSWLAARPALVSITASTTTSTTATSAMTTTTSTTLTLPLTA